MNKHTPGPWFIYADTNVMGLIPGYGKRLVANTGGHSSNREDTTEMNRANAALIAKAPALLAALSALADAAEDTRECAAGNEDWNRLTETVAIARALLAEMEKGATGPTETKR